MFDTIDSRFVPRKNWELRIDVKAGLVVGMPAIKTTDGTWIEK